MITKQRQRCHEFDEDQKHAESLVRYSALLMAATVMAFVVSTLTTAGATESSFVGGVSGGQIVVESENGPVEDEVVVTIPLWRRAHEMIIIQDIRPAESTVTARPAEARSPLGIPYSPMPSIALRAYHAAADKLGEQKPSCGIEWALIAAIGRVESNHGQYGGARLGPDGVTTRPIRGIPLDGRPGVAHIADTDRGALDGDSRYDRAMGPMQFIPSTWRAVFPTGDPDNIFDAAFAAGRYLCAGGGNLRENAHRERAVFRYNHSNEYVRLVLSIAENYRTGAVAIVDPTRPPLIAQAAEPGPGPMLIAPSSTDQSAAQVTTDPTSTASATPATPPTVTSSTAISPTVTSSTVTSPTVTSSPAQSTSSQSVAPSTPPEQTSDSDAPAPSPEPSSSAPSSPQTSRSAESSP